jgi:hypothetical protein
MGRESCIKVFDGQIYIWGQLELPEDGNCKLIDYSGCGRKFSVPFSMLYS